MKKLMIAAAVALAATFANAGVYIWGFQSGADIIPGGTANVDYMDGGTAMLFLGTIAQTATGEGSGIDAKYNLDFSGLTYIASSGNNGDPNYDYGHGNFDAGYTNANIDDQGGQAYTLILFNDSGVTDYENYEGYYYALTGTSVGTQDADSGTDYAKFVTSSPVLGDMWRTAGPAAPTPPEPIPEPTSGLLVLLGIAGLALKRKQA